MQIKTLLVGLILGLFMITAMTGCDDHGHSHDNGNPHESAKQKTDSNNHDTID